MQTNVPNIFAIGDVAGKCMLASSADREGLQAAKFILVQNPTPINYNTIPSTIFSLPEVASVGISENKAREKGLEVIVGKATYAANSKALIANERDGFAKIVADKSTREILGVHIIGEKATELIAIASVAISQKLTVDQLAENVFGHPILGEVLKDACEACQ
jgi:dihydrolipoamide dehydrogenase